MTSSGTWLTSECDFDNVLTCNTSNSGRPVTWMIKNFYDDFENNPDHLSYVGGITIDCSKYELAYLNTLNHNEHFEGYSFIQLIAQYAH